MRLWRTGTITARTRTFSGCDRFEVHTEDGPVRAVAYHAIVGHLRVGERVIMNCAALARGLGTGGVAFVIAPADRLPDDDRESFGHIVKGRYLPTQVMVGAVDEQDSPHHEVFCDPAPLTGVPVVVADLHSAVPAVLAGLRLDRPQARAAYVMSDGAALPAAFSVSAALMREAGLLEGIVTCGQSFGGDLEATSVANGIIAAHRVLNADVVVIAQGPGNVGTGTTYGFSGLDTAWHLAQARMVGAVPIAVARASGADPRARHRGLSHHSTTVLDDALTFPVHLPVPAATEGTPVNSAHEALRTAASARG
ncbi:MAG: DUF3866 family protein, partial [Bowdeniella nasicola]|nr:DUF3866 family protein [Bowdeniella nasicola]